MQVPRVPIRIDTVTLQGGAVNFSDKYIKPNYSASLVEVGGRVSGLSSEESRLADINLRGKLENSAPLEIVGKINPLAKDLFLDLKVDFRDMDLSPLSPYSGRYAGYEIQKGKLTLNLKYHIEKGKLDSENRVFLDQFTFGEAVDSPNATKLPVWLAVALLKDRSGEIHLDLPVTGSIDDPKFSIWGVVWKIIGNLLVEAATSPFALLGAVFGGGEQLSYLEFAPGIADIPATEDRKLGNLAKASHDRPSLKLEIEGHVDIEKDREGMRQLIFRGRLRPRSWRTSQQQDNRRRRWTTCASRRRSIRSTWPGPIRWRNFRMGKVEPERIFLVKSKTLPPERKEKLRDSRVTSPSSEGAVREAFGRSARADPGRRWSGRR